MGKPRTTRSEPSAIASIDGPALARAFAAGAEALRRQADAINAINVFPVPDGDTGTNMALTMRAAVEEIERDSGGSAASVVKACARGALIGAKGNSGVILSQILRGLADVPDGLATLDARTLARGLANAREAAYRVVSEPKEGTILTAISAAAAASCSDSGAEAALAAAVEAAREAVARTPELLPVLKEAGVVDSGAEGLYVLLDGCLRGLRGEELSAPDIDAGAIDPAWLGARSRAHAHDATGRGYCVEFIVRGDRIDDAALRERLLALGESVLIVGGGELVRAHVHTREPDAAFAAGREAGAVSHDKADDLEAQFRALAARTEPPPPVDGIAVVAVAAGAGFEELFASMGNVRVVRGGQTMNPSAGEIRDAIVATGARGVIVLPNNKNVVLAARQAAEGMPNVRVVETRTVPQGVAAIVALNTEQPLEDNAAAMQYAAASVRTAEITLAARPTRVHGIDVREGQPIGLIDGDLAVADETVAGAVRACVERMIEGRPDVLVTLYPGEGEDEAAANALAESVAEAFGVEVQVVAGGQPHYPYLVGVE